MGKCYTSNNQKKAEMALLMSNKVDYKAKNITRDNDKEINSPRGFNSPKRLYTYQQSSQIHEIKN